MKTSYIKDLEDDNVLSYGTVVIIKQNVGAPIGMSFNVTLTFDVWDYTKQGRNIQSLIDVNFNGEESDGEGSDGEDDGDNGNGCAKKQKFTRRKR